MRKFSVYWRPAVLSFWYYLFSFPLINTALHILLWGDFFFLQIFMKHSFVKKWRSFIRLTLDWVFYSFFFFSSHEKLKQKGWPVSADASLGNGTWFVAMKTKLANFLPTILRSSAYWALLRHWPTKPHGSPLLHASGFREEWSGGESCKLGHREARLFWGWAGDQTMSFAKSLSPV